MRDPGNEVAKLNAVNISGTWRRLPFFPRSASVACLSLVHCVGIAVTQLWFGVLSKHVATNS